MRLPKASGGCRCKSRKQKEKLRRNQQPQRRKQPQCKPLPRAPSQPPAETAAQPWPPPKQFPIKIDHFLLREASFNFCDKNRKPIVAADGINMLSAYPTVDAVTGSASVHQISVQNLFFIRNCQTEFSYSPEHLSLFNARCVIAGGRLYREPECEDRRAGNAV